MWTLKVTVIIISLGLSKVNENGHLIDEYDARDDFRYTLIDITFHYPIHLPTELFGDFCALCFD
jgi:hypothetical protein